MEEKVVSRKHSMMIITITATILLFLGSMVGYAFFWEQYDTTPSSEKKVAALQEQMFVNPNETSTQLELAWIYYHNKDYLAAKEQFEVLLSRDENNIDAGFGLANALIGLGSYQDAEQLLLDLREGNEGDSDILHTLGIIQREQGRLEEAEQTLLLSLQINRISADIYFDLGLVYEKLNNVEEAIAHYQKSIDFVPDYQDSVDGLARLGVESYTAKRHH